MAVGLKNIWNWVVASDPGLTRLRAAVNAGVAMATVLGLEALYARALGVGGLAAIVLMLLGGVIAMSGSMALTGSDVWAKLKVAAGFPVAVGAAVALGIAVGTHTVLMLGVFVVVMFIAVAMRTLGAAYFYYGFMAWLGYFFATLTGVRWNLFLSLIGAVVLASAWLWLLTSTVLRTRPRRSLKRSMDAFGTRARGVAGLIGEVIRAPDTARRERMRLLLRTRSAQLAETALMVEGWLAEPGAVPAGWSLLAVRRRLLDVQQLLDRMAADAIELAADRGTVGELAAEVAEAISRREDQRAIQTLVYLDEVEGPERGAALDFANAAAQFLALAAEVRWVRQIGGTLSDAEEFEPAVSLFQEALPGSPATVKGVSARGPVWNPMIRWDLPLRQAVQVAVAGGLAIIAGRLLSPDRYYWAVIAAFIMSAGTATRIDAVLKGANRVLGTLAGLAAALLVANLTAGHVLAVLIVIVLSLFLGQYLMRLSYAYFIFFLTIMLGELYSILHEFSAALLVIRLEETAVGAAIGIGVALLVLPLSTRDSVAAVRQAFLQDLAKFLHGAADAFDHPEEGGRLDGLVRAVENRHRQLRQIADPVTPPLAWGFSRPEMRHRLGMYAALSGYVRSLAAALRVAPAEDRTPVLARACRQLAQVVTALAQNETQPLEKSLRSIEVPLSSNRINSIARPLSQIRKLLLDFETSEPL